MLKRLLTPFKGLLVRLSYLECAAAARWAAGAHKRLFKFQWYLPPEPEYFDHDINLFYQWKETRNSLGWERGCFGGLALKGNGTVLELSCGDGFNTRNFYSLRAKRVVACDFDPEAISVAKRKNSAPNVTFVVADVRLGLPEGRFDNVVWDGAIEHFTPEEIADILRRVKAHMTEDGVLSGYTIQEAETGNKALTHHEYEFKSKEDLLRVLEPHFKNVCVFETVYPDRHNLYFWASDGIIPFQERWEQAVYSSAGKLAGSMTR